MFLPCLRTTFPHGKEPPRGVVGGLDPARTVAGPPLDVELSEDVAELELVAESPLDSPVLDSKRKSSPRTLLLDYEVEEFVPHELRMLDCHLV